MSSSEVSKWVMNDSLPQQPLANDRCIIESDEASCYRGFKQ